jgi:hypothetical protein
VLAASGVVGLDVDGQVLIVADGGNAKPNPATTELGFTKSIRSSGPVARRRRDSVRAVGSARVTLV